jgi:hypothetical protein
MTEWPRNDTPLKKMHPPQSLQPVATFVIVAGIGRLGRAATSSTSCWVLSLAGRP